MRPRNRQRGEGQSLVEFTLVLVPLLVIILGIAQFGFIFNAYVTVANAAREGARAGSIWVPNVAVSQGVNDTNRNAYISSNVNATMGILPDADNVTVTYSYPTNVNCPQPQPQGMAGMPEPTDPRRKGHYVCVRVTHQLNLFIPLVDQIIGSGGGTMDITTVSQMVIN